MPKTLGLSAASIGNVLKRAGLSRSETSKGAARGTINRSSGYKVTAPGSATYGGDRKRASLARIEYIPGLGSRQSEMIAQMLIRYEELLTKAGYKVERTAFNGVPEPEGKYLFVYSPEGADAA
jgi:hypothetical protein